MAASTSLYSYIARNLSYDWVDLHLKKSGHLRRSYADSEMLSGKQWQRAFCYGKGSERQHRHLDLRILRLHLNTILFRDQRALV